MKRIIIFCLISFAALSFTFAQGPPERVEKEGRGERVKAMRIAYITSKLELTPEESQNFWPIFNEMEEKHRALRKNFRSGKIEPATEEEARKALEDQLAMEEAQVALKREYIPKLNGVISYKKLYKLKRADKEFKQELLNRARGKRRE